MKEIKELSIYSFLFGLAAGVVSILPAVGIIVFLAILFCTSIAVFFIMIYRGTDLTINESKGLGYGAVSGFLSIIGFACSFLPISFVLSLIFKQSYFTGISFIVKNGFSLMFMIIFAVAVLSAMMNAFSGLAGMGLVESLKKRK